MAAWIEVASAMVSQLLVSRASSTGQVEASTHSLVPGGWATLNGPRAGAACFGF